MEYDQERLYERLDAEKEARALSPDALEKERADHAASIGRLEAGIQLLDQELQVRDEKTREQTERISDLEAKLKAEQNTNVALQTIIQYLEQECKDLNATLSAERSTKSSLQTQLQSEGEGHASTQTHLTNAANNSNTWQQRYNHVHNDLSQARTN